MIVVSSAAAVRAIMDKQGSATGGRPRNLPMTALRGLYITLADMNSSFWRRGRKTIHRFFTPESIELHLPVMTAESLQLVNDLLDDPTNVFMHTMRTTCSIMTSLLYGKQTPKYHGTDAEAFVEGIKLLSAANDTTSFPPTEIMPFVDYIPGWLAPWGAHMRRMVAVRDELYYRLLGEVEEKICAGIPTNSYVEDVLENQKDLDVSREEIAHLGSALMDAGAETAASFIQNIVLALITYPELQQKAQQEMDRVVGAGRMPTLEDYDSLPYLKAFVEELHRFRTLVPIAVPHLASEDVSYNGYIIPKGATIIQNSWGINHDPAMFDDPDVFRPERFLDSQYGTKAGADVSDYRDNFSFGSGRRICPGEIVGRRMIALSAMNFVWGFNFTSLEEISLSLEMKRFIAPGIELSPKDFHCHSKVRDTGREKLIREMYSYIQNQ